jgi:hypothetical protein
VDEPIDAADLITATDKGIALDLMDKGFGGAARFVWDESQHPRVPKGSGDPSGEFTGDGGSVTAWHGTVEENLDSIREHGILDRSKLKKSFKDSALYEDERGRSVYVAAERETASFYAKYLKQNESGTPIILQLRIPRTAFNNFKKDMLSDSGASAYGPKIEPDWIVGAERVAGKGKFEKVFTQQSQEEKSLFAVILVDGSSKNMVWDESQHPRHPTGTDQGGEFAPAGTGGSVNEDGLNRIMEADRERGVEHAILYDKDGNVLLEKDGEATMVEFTDTEAAMMSGGVLVHNHHNGSSLSAQDLVMQNRSGLSEITAVTSDGGIYTGRVLMAERDLVNGYNAADRFTYHKLNPLMQDGSLSPSNANLLHTHVVNTAMRNVGIIDYIEEPGWKLDHAKRNYDSQVFGGVDGLVDVVTRFTAGAVE